MYVCIHVSATQTVFKKPHIYHIYCHHTRSTPSFSILVSHTPQWVTVLTFTGIRVVSPILGSHVTGTLQYALFCAYLALFNIQVSRLMHIIECPTTYPFLLLSSIRYNTTISLSILLLMAIWVVSSLGLLCIKLL